MPWSAIGSRRTLLLAGLTSAGGHATTAPTHLVATPSAGKILLSWDTLPGSVTSVNVYRGTTSGGETLLASGVSITPPYVDSAITARTVYYYKITAVSSLGESGFSNEASAVTQAFTEFYVNAAQTNASNLNAGSTDADITYTSAAGDSDGTSVFTPNDGSTPASTVSAGMWGSVYVTIGATVAVFIGRVTTVAAGVNGAITFSTTAKAGTFPASSAGAHTITCRIGGAWTGPATTVSFPIGFVAATMTDAAGDYPRVNGKGTSTITAAMTQSSAGPVRFQGYTTNPGDGGRWTIAGGAAGTSYTALTVSGADYDLVDMTFVGNGATGSAALVLLSNNRAFCERVVFSSCVGAGVNVTGGNIEFTECEWFGCNSQNNASTPALNVANNVFCDSCYFHDNAGSNTRGARLANASCDFISCIFDTNGAMAIEMTTAAAVSVIGCDFYNNGGSGIVNTDSTGGFINARNCNFLKNTLWAATGSGVGNKRGRFINCGFGTGTQANGSGDVDVTNLPGVVVSNSVTYASGVTPWTAPTTGNFTISLAAAQGTGRLVFTETDGTNTGTVAHPDVGAAQS